MISKNSVFLLLLVVGLTMSRPGGIGHGGILHGYGDPHHHHHHHHPKPYEFGYGVVDPYTGNDFGHSEISDGGVVSGKYFVLLPDGRRQVVTYTADHLHGYQAQVSYEGAAQFPQHHGGYV